MNPAALPDYYETLQLSSRADGHTVERVFRLLAKRFHPDNGESGDVTRFTELMEAFRVLSDPEARARYDARYEEVREEKWRLYEKGADGTDMATDRRVRNAILSLLYTARRTDSDHPGVGTVELERLLGCPEEHMRFHLWYLKENRWIERMENGMLAITAAGVDRVMELGGPARDTLHLIGRGEEDDGPIAAAAG